MMEKRITVIGAGTAGSAIISNLKENGYYVVVGLRNPSKYPGALSIKDALNESELIFLALPYEAGEEVVRKHASLLKNKIIIDMMNPFGPKLEYVKKFDGKSGAEHLQTLIPDATVVSTFNYSGGPVLEKPQNAFIFVIGEAGVGREKVTEIARSIGFDAHEIGGLEKARQSEEWALLWTIFALIDKKDPALYLKLT